MFFAPGFAGLLLTSAVAANTFEGSPVDLCSLRDEVVVLNLGATWCAPCRQELPMPGRAARRSADRGVASVALPAGVVTPGQAEGALDALLAESPAPVADEPERAREDHPSALPGSKDASLVPS